MTSFISALPDLCLLKIFDYLSPLQVLADVPLVCRRWTELQLSALQRRRSLTLNLVETPSTLETPVTPYSAVISGASRQQQPSTTDYTGLTLNYPFSNFSSKRLIILLQNTFSKMEHLSLWLEVTASRVDDFILPLIKSWSFQIKSLSLGTALYFSINSTDQREIISAKLYDLLDAINSLPHLKHLKLQIKDYFHYSLSARVDLPIISRLSSFSFYSLDNVMVIYDSLRNYGTSETLQKITVDQKIFSLVVLNTFFQLNSMVRFKFTTLKLSFQNYLQNEEEVTPSVLNSIALHFPHLHSLSIPMDKSVSLATLSQCLAGLHQLTDLELSLDFAESKRPSLLSENRLTKAEEIVPLSSLRKLSLTLYIDHSHTDGQSVHFGRLFPALTHLQLAVDIITACAACRVESFRMASEAEKLTCLQRLVDPWNKTNSTLQSIKARYGKTVHYQYNNDPLESNLSE